jgi:hypothetical protein
MESREAVRSAEDGEMKERHANYLIQFVPIIKYQGIDLGVGSLVHNALVL